MLCPIILFQFYSWLIKFSLALARLMLTLRRATHCFLLLSRSAMSWSEMIIFIQWLNMLLPKSTQCVLLDNVSRQKVSAHLRVYDSSMPLIRCLFYIYRFSWPVQVRFQSLCQRLNVASLCHFYEYFYFSFMSYLGFLWWIY